MKATAALAERRGGSEMDSDDLDSGEAEASRAKAARLREQIDRLKRDRNGGALEEPADAESPRDFVERRMREIEAKDQDDAVDRGPASPQ
jgi:hypothetical protein